MQKRPSVDEVRPPRCADCDGAAREPGRALGIIGHGLRDRQQRGPVAPDVVPTVEIVLVRRYLCRHCAAVMTVVPRDVEPRRHYARPAMALALARLGLLGETEAAVRRSISPMQVVVTDGWRTLRRWTTAVREGVIFGAARPATAASNRDVSARVAQLALGYAPPTLRGAPALVLVFAGAIAMA